MNQLVIGVVGNPNCGKTTLFNVLTGSKQEVGNWPGVTVERKIGHYKQKTREIAVVDLPGIYSLDAIPGGTSLDEKIAQDYILSGEARLIVNILDASNLERNLYLTTQLLEMGVPMIIALNMMDIAKQRNIQIDIDILTEQLGVPIIPLVAAKKEGIVELKQAIDKASTYLTLPPIKVEYPQIIEEAIAELQPLIVTHLSPHQQAGGRWLTLKCLEGDKSPLPHDAAVLEPLLTTHCQKIAEELEEDIDILIADSRYAFISTIVEDAVKKIGQVSQTLSDRIDKVVLNRVLGIPIFLIVMYLMFTFTIHIGGAFVDFFDQFVGTIVVDGFTELLARFHAPEWLVTLLANGIGGGIQVIATFIPIIGFLYLFLSFLEDSGYMARAAFVMDRFMRLVGLPGKSFVPMIVGFGCNVPAIMATRTLENQRDRTLTILMEPFMSCGARLQVYVLFTAVFFASSGQNIVFLLYLLGIAAAILTGLIMKTTLLKGEISPFIMELPPYHLPRLQGMMLHTWDRLKNFIFRAGKVIIPMVALISFLNSWGTDGTFGNENSNNSVLSEIGRSITPVFTPMGIGEDNWPATVGIFTGVLAKEVVVGTLDAIYSQLAEQEAGFQTSEAEFDLWTQLNAAIATIPTNLMAVADNLLDPLGLSIAQVENLEEAAAAQEVNMSTFTAMTARFDGQVGAFAYLLFILLYAPCVAAIAAIYRETNLKWALFSVFWTTGLAYLFAVITYQTATFTQHPLTSGMWIGGLTLTFLLVIFTLRFYGRLESKS